MNQRSMRATTGQPQAQHTARALFLQGSSVSWALDGLARRLRAIVVLSLLGLTGLPGAAMAEGSAEFDAADTGIHNSHDQAVNSDTVLRIDILAGGQETVCWRGNGSVALSQPNGTAVGGNITNGNCRTTVSGVSGAYYLELNSTQVIGNEWDIRVCGVANAATCLTNSANERTGRVWSTQWVFRSNTSYARSYSVNGSVYAIVPGGASGRDAVIEMEMRGVSGAYYDLFANSIGPEDDNGVRVGRSVPESGHDVSPEFPIYLNPPAVASYNWIVPQVTDIVLSPGCGTGVVQDTAPGLVTFNSNVSGQYVLVCDANEDGIYDFASNTDFSSLGVATAGNNAVSWDGTNNAGATVPEGDYNCVVRLNVGEYHYVARDIETAYPGIRMYRVERSGSTYSRTPISMYWDDRLAPGDGTTMFGGGGQVSPTSSPALGLNPGTYGSTSSAFYYSGSTPIGNARAWGDYNSGTTDPGKGNNAFLDQFSSADSVQSAPFSVSVISDSGDADTDGLTNARECAIGSDPQDPDTDDDGVYDGFEASATTTPNSDSDTLIDVLDPDDDGDGIPTLVELGQTNGDGDPSDAANSDSDGPPDYLDTDSDNDGVGDATDVSRTNPNACADTDNDNCDDCSQTGADQSGGDPSRDGADTDGDQACDLTDVDDDDDGVCDGPAAVGGVCTAGPDTDRTSATACADSDGDTCDDCSAGNGAAPANDGTDTDQDGLCDAGDPDDDGDGVCDGAVAVSGVCVAGPDTDRTSATACADSDGDTCDDCSAGGGRAPGNDGPDLDNDGLCDVGDPDVDGDGVANAADVAPRDQSRCRDSDSDTCDDCAVANLARPGNDGQDTDGDGLCDAGDPDDDGDGVADGDDLAPLDATVCRDADADTCDDCSVASMDAPNNDGPDTDSDGLCDAGDPDDDGDGVCDDAVAVPPTCVAGPDTDSGDPRLCGDSDGDDCDDCASGSFDPTNDGPDSDGDGQCDGPDVDGDGRCDGAAAVPDVCVAGPDSEPTDGMRCGDTDSDGCDDCSSGSFDTANDGPDSDGDGQCDTSADFDGDGLSDADDLDDDGDGILDRRETLLDLDPSADADGDGVPNYIDVDDRGDGQASSCVDAQQDGRCDTISRDFDRDGDGMPNHHDLDADGDTISDADEAGHSGPDVDRDGRVDGATGNNGVADGVEAPADSAAVMDPVDSDSDGVPDFLDDDSDDDGLSDAREAGDLDRATPPVDTDDDGLADYRDPDDDNDGVPTVDERDGDQDRDTDDDAIPDHLDSDDDGDGIPTIDEPGDVDGDGVPDRLKPPVGGSLAGGALCTLAMPGQQQLSTAPAFALLLLVVLGLRRRRTRTPG